MTRVAILGLGLMGSRMATRLIDTGHDVTIWNRSAGATRRFAGRARIADTPRDAATDAALVLTMVRDDDAARAVWLDPQDGALAGMSAGTVAVDSSTVTPGWAVELHAACADRGIAALDAPVSGSLPQAEAGQLIFLVGGDAAALAGVEPVLLAMGSAAHHVGPAGSGARIKLAINALLAIQVAAGAELLGVLAGHGLSPARAAEVIGTVPVTSPALKNYMAGMAAGRFVPAAFPVAMIEKDLRYALEMAAGAPAPLAHAAREVYLRGLDAGLADENMNAVAKLYATP